ncbi:hypothetical protein [Arcicella lustrica]|uniref:Uncharacterized protein n=1 Tax=Arcicella lustrica TaxID=2984196 RepID=A0ABU5SGW9_9BACT|nr:hypothetical protein [Arcicella sp. DC25W]MEA5426537.1 hypothetical protein [Arcicella sp. DC25W]
MGFLYSSNDKEIYAIRRKIFTEKGLPLLFNIGFEKSPFSGACFGRYNNQLHSYDLCRLTEDSMLQKITVHISRSDRWIQISLNIFQLDKTINSLLQLNSVDGIKYSLPPNSISNMQLNVDDFKGIPLLNYDFMFRSHKLAHFWTKRGFEKSLRKLEFRIVEDLSNFEKYIDRWHKMYNPLNTTIEGNIIGFEKMTINERLEATRLTKRFNDTKYKNNAEAMYILKWLDVDDLTIQNILGLK